MSDDDELVTGHAYQGELTDGCQYEYPQGRFCGFQARQHADPGPTSKRHLLDTHPHDFVPGTEPSLCGYRVDLGGTRICGYPLGLHLWADRDRAQAARASVGAVVRMADIAQYERQPMPDAARQGPVVTLIDAPMDPLGTLAVIGGIYQGSIARSKAEVTDAQRRAMLADMQKTALDGPLECVQFTFLIEGVSRAFTHQAVRNRFSFFAQESLRFAVAEDWAQEIPLPPALSSAGDEDPAVGMWRKAMNQAEDAYAALVGAGMPAEEARGVLPHAITTRYYWTVSLRTLLQEAGKRTCTQAQFDWRVVMAGVAKALRTYSHPFASSGEDSGGYCDAMHDQDHWQYQKFADLIRPVCYREGGCKFMAAFDRGCTIRSRVDAFEQQGIPSAQWSRGSENIPPIDPSEWAADPGAARVVPGAQ